MEMPHWTAELEGGGSMPTVHHSSGRTATRRRAGPGRAHRRARNTWEENGSSEDGGCGSGSGFTVATTVVAQMMGGPSFGAKFKGATAMTTKNDVGEMATMGSALICATGGGTASARQLKGDLGPKFFLSSYSSFCMMETLAR